MTQNVIVTGGAGYIGSMGAKLLKKEGYQPIIVDNFVSGSKNLIKFGILEQADIGDIQAMEAIFNKYKPIAVMHFAASSIVPESVSNPAKYYKNNVCGTLGLLQAMHNTGVKNIIFSSTAAIFGQSEKALISENDPIQPINSYGSSKAMVEKILDDFDTAYGMKHIAFRYFNVIGADPELEVGNPSYPGTHLLSLIFYKAVNKEDFLIYGDDYNTEDGTCIRDYIHVYDVAMAHVLAMKKLLKDQKSMKINLGSGKGFSVKEIVDVAKDVLEVKFNVTTVERRPGDPAKLVTDVTLARNYLNWQLKFLDLKEGITHAWKWFKKFNNVKL